MTMESDLQVLLEGLCDDVHPMTAPIGTPVPYVTWQHIGGQSWRFVENTAADNRHTLMQINVWAATLLGALTLVRQIEAAMCATAAFTATPEAEPIGQNEPDFDRYGFIQDFAIVSAR